MLSDCHGYFQSRRDKCTVWEVLEGYEGRDLSNDAKNLRLLSFFFHHQIFEVPE